MTHIYDEHETLGVLRFIVQQKGPEFVYPRQKALGYICVYWDRQAGCASCLVGHVLAQLGFTDPPPNIEGFSIASVILGEAGDEAEVYWRERFTVPALRLLAAAQDEQDGGESWGVALRAAEARYRLVSGG